MKPILYGGVEAGGTKFVCGVGTGPHDVETALIPTTTPDETIARCLGFFRGRGIAALGIGAFGPVDLDAGRITNTPKAAWRDCGIAEAFRGALGVPVAFDTDVNAALAGEARWGAARGVANCLYMTVGTGIGGAALVSGQVLRGVSHPEMGHLRVPRHPADADFQGVCPFHRDCLEGLASGPARNPRTSYYLAHALAGLVCVLSPELCILGGGVMQAPGVRDVVRAILPDLLAGYVPTPKILAPELGDRAGVLGALALAEQATR